LCQVKINQSQAAFPNLDQQVLAKLGKIPSSYQVKVNQSQTAIPLEFINAWTYAIN
jgi:hypothetical protein